MWTTFILHLKEYLIRYFSEIIAIMISNTKKLQTTIFYAGISYL